MYKELSKLLYGASNPYSKCKGIDNFPVSDYPHTNIYPSLIRESIEETGTDFWLEIGSMFGGSAIETAKVAAEIKSNFLILCIDPFCGDVSMWENHLFLKEEKKKGFIRKNSIPLDLDGCRPTLMDRFLGNVISEGFEKTILPLPTTSMVGMRLLERFREDKKIDRGPGVIYLDSAHEWYETYIELVTAWRILAPGGILIGDDYDWPAVNHDVNKFSRDYKVEILEKEKAHWMIKKPLTVGYLASPFFMGGY
jgi:predicted O-methyltransferase YrrM